MSNIDNFFQQFVESPDKEGEIIATATSELTGNELKVLMSRIQGKKRKEEASRSKGREKSTVGAGTEDSFVDLKEERDLVKEQKLVDQFWKELESMDPVSLLSDDVLDAFKYVGFNPDILLREFLHRGRVSGKNGKEISKDLIDVVTIAIIKGSVTEKNLKKTSDSGKVLYKKLQDVYDLQTGGARSRDSSYLTVARVAAAVPGTITSILVKKPEFAKTFVGPFGSKSLPTYLRHQSAAACIPSDTPERLKDFLLGLITAFTADQTKALSKSKATAEELFDNQLNFVMTTFSSSHPSEQYRKKIFQQFSLSNDFEKLLAVGLRVKKVKPEFVVLTQQELDSDLVK